MFRSAADWHDVRTITVKSFGAPFRLPKHVADIAIAMRGYGTRAGGPFFKLSLLRQPRTLAVKGLAGSV